MLSFFFLSFKKIYRVSPFIFRRTSSRHPKGNQFGSLRLSYALVVRRSGHALLESRKSKLHPRPVSHHGPLLEKFILLHAGTIIRIIEKDRARTSERASELASVRARIDYLRP